MSTPQSKSKEDNCDCDKTNKIDIILDTEISIENGRVKIDLQRKKTHVNQYLHLSSFHPKAISKAIPQSLALKIIRICTNKSRIRETKNLSTNADSRTDTILERLSDLSR